VTFKINSAPTAIATISATAVYTGDIVTLDASTSDTNPPGGTLTYLWQQTAPATPNISLAPNNKAVMATFAAPAPPAGADSQAVTFDVKVTDDSVSGGAKNTTSDPVTTTVYRLPVANAGPDQSVDQGTLVMLNGSGSTGVNLTYAWTAPAGITLSDPTAANPTFYAPAFTPPNGMSYTFTLKVTEHRAGFDPKESKGGTR
jgi:large repetitive protein